MPPTLPGQTTGTGRQDMTAPTTLAAAVTRYLQTLPATLAPATVANYTRDLHELLDIAGAETHLIDLTGPALDTITRLYGNRPDTRYHRPHADRDGTPKTRSRGAQARFRHSLTRLLTHAHTQHWIPTNPTHDAAYRPRATPTRTTRGPLTAHLIDTLIDHARTHAQTDPTHMRLAARDETILRLLATHAPTAAQIAATNTAHYDRPTATLTLPALGAQPQITAPLDEATTTALHTYLDHERPTARPRITKTTAPDGTRTATTTTDARDAQQALLLTWRGRRITARDIQNMVRARAAILPRPSDRAATPHTLRGVTAPHP